MVGKIYNNVQNVLILVRTKIDQLEDNTTEIKHRISQKKKSYKCFKFYLVVQKYYKK
jgi:hypothetical protein